VGQIIFTLGWIIGGVAQPDSYHWASQEISDLGALTASHAWVWNTADSLSGALTVVFAIGFYSVVRDVRAGRIGSVLIGLAGFGDVLDGLVREDCPLSTSAVCQAKRDGPGLSWHHNLHDLESGVVIVCLVLAPLVLSGAFRRLGRWRLLVPYTLSTGVAVIVGLGAYYLRYGESGGGTAQRALASVALAWVAVLALWMLVLLRAPAEAAP
jgi:uncharacterized protein DUF998